MDAEAVQAALELEALTNDRLANTAVLKAIPKEDHAFGQGGSSIAMAAFLHGGPGRFNGPDIGAWYAALDVNTAVAETLYHHERRLKASVSGFPNLVQMRELVSTPTATMVDIRGKQAETPEIYHETDYRHSREFGEDVRREGGDGIWFSSVRRPGGENIALYKPRLVVPIRQGDHYEYTWDADGTSHVYRLTNVA